MSSSSYRTILRASSIIGGASVINILAGLFKMKVAAVLLGPAGVGLIGLYTALMSTAGAIAGLGLVNSGTRQVAAAGAQGGAVEIGRVRRALFWGTLVQALLGAALFWLASGWMARDLVGEPDRAVEIAWLALGVGLTVAAGAQLALLTGLRRVADIARLQVVSGVVGAALGAMALWIWGTAGLLAMVLIAPAATFLVGHIYVARLERPAGPPESAPVLLREWAAMARLGFPFMISGLVTMAGFLAVRLLVQNDLGSEAVGHYQAAWMIGMTYLTFVLGAMATDYYPRLVAVITDHAASVRLVNEQTEVALLLCGPPLVALIGLAPWVVTLLFSAEFGPTVEVLRWHLLGDILKVLSWPLGFVLLAAGAGKTFVLTETAAIGALVLAVALCLPLLGLTATGVAFLLCYVIYLPLVWVLARQRIGFRWTRAVKGQAVLLIVAALAVEAAARWSNIGGAVAGLVLGTALALWALLRLAAVSDTSGKLVAIARAGERLRTWILTRL